MLRKGNIMSNRIQSFIADYISETTVEEISHSLHEPDWVLARRKQAFQKYIELQVDADTLFYKYTNFRKFNAADLKLYTTATESLPMDFSLEGIDDEFTVVQEPKNVVVALSAELVDKGVYYGTLSELIKNDELLAKKILEKAEISKSFDKFAALARALASNIIILYVPRSVEISKPLLRKIQLGTEQLAVFSEFIAYFEENAHATFVDFYTSQGTDSSQQMFSEAQTLLLDSYASMKALFIQNWNHNVVHLTSRFATVENSARLYNFGHFQGGEITRHNSSVNLHGDNSEAYDLFLQFGTKRERFDIKSELTHHAKNTIGQTHARTVMMDRAESVLRGLITIPKTGINADSYLSSTGLTVDKAKINAIPALIIDQNDVKAAHAASVEPLDYDKIFYIESRGVEEQDAKSLLIKGYFNPALRVLNDETFNAYSEYFINEKWQEHEGGNYD